MAAERFIQVKNWSRFQHYKKRNPPWIRLYNELLDDYPFQCLQDASKWHAVGLWLLASRLENRIPADPIWIAQRIGASDPVDLAPLVSAGFISYCEDASNVRASCKQDATPEGEAEAEGEAEVLQQNGFYESDEIVDVENSTESEEPTTLGTVLAPLIREHLYADGKAPTGWNEERDISICAGLLKRYGDLDVGELAEMVPLLKPTLGIGPQEGCTMKALNGKARADSFERVRQAARKKRGVRPEGLVRLGEVLGGR